MLALDALGSLLVCLLRFFPFTSSQSLLCSTHLQATEDLLPSFFSKTTAVPSISLHAVDPQSAMDGLGHARLIRRQRPIYADTAVAGPAQATTARPVAAATTPAAPAAAVTTTPARGAAAVTTTPAAAGGRGTRPIYADTASGGVPAGESFPPPIVQQETRRVRRSRAHKRFSQPQNHANDFRRESVASSLATTPSVANTVGEFFDPFPRRPLPEHSCCLRTFAERAPRRMLIDSLPQQRLALRLP